MQFNFKLLRRFTLATFLCIAGPAAANADGHGTGGWDHFIGLYLWGMSIDGTASVGPVDAPLDLNFKDDLLDNLAGAFSAHYEAKKGKLTLFGDYMYADLDPKTELANGAEIDVDFTNKMWELGVAWDLTEATANTTWQVLGGVRSNKQEFRLQVGSPVLVSVNETWYDGFIGGRVIAPLSSKWKFVGRADIGAGDSDSVLNVLGAFDWRFNNWGSLLLGYRWMDFDYDNGKKGSERYAYDATQAGPLFAFNVYW
jgi:hypothetical protein